jgi:hypothetical protein
MALFKKGKKGSKGGKKKKAGGQQFMSGNQQMMGQYDGMITPRNENQNMERVEEDNEEDMAPEEQQMME